MHRRRKFWFSLLLLSVLLSGMTRVVTGDSSFDDDIPPHPRFFFSTDDIDGLREKTATTHRAIWQPILDYATRRLDRRLPSETPEEDAPLDFFRNAGNNLVALSFACVMTGAGDYCELAKSHLLITAGWEQWDESNRRGLGVAHLLQGSAIAYDWLYDQLTPDERRLVRASLIKWAGRIYEASTANGYSDDWENWWRKSYVQNHYFIIHSALGMAGLALLEPPSGACSVTAYGNVNRRSGPSTDYEVLDTLRAGESADVIGEDVDAEGFVWWQLSDATWVRSDVVRASDDCGVETSADAQTWIDHARARLLVGRDVLDGIGDGSWHEGIPYQSYFLSMSLPFMVNLRRIEGTDLLPDVYLRSYATWQLYNHLSNDKFILSYGNFDEWWETKAVSLGPLRFVASEYDDPYAEWVAGQLEDDLPTDASVMVWYTFEFLYYDAGLAPQLPDDLPGARTFEDAEAVIWRTGWDADDWVFGFKTGPYGGRFVFDTFVQGLYPWEQPCVQTGCQLNMDHDHNDTNGFYIFGGGEWAAPEGVSYNNHYASHHNVILVDGEDQYRPPTENYGVYAEDFIGSDGFLEATANTPHFSYLAADATRRYKQIPGIEDITRYVLFVRPGYWLMLDSMAADEPHLYEWVAHFGDSIGFDDGWVRGYTNGDPTLGVAVVAPESFQVNTGEDDYPYMRTQPTAYVDDLRFVHLLYPAADEAAWEARPEVELLADTGEAVAVRVAMQDGQDDVLLSYANPLNGATVGPYEYDGQAAVITTGPDGELQKLFVYDGTFLFGEDYDQMLVSGLDPGGSFEAVYAEDGALIEVSGELGDEVTLYAPDAGQLTVNGEAWPFRRSDDYIVFGK
ncbi:MAG: SH3 domain-containing protein [Anaerolineae bacterium]|nr:SH3 domain-containing protein [Anaerolineae bacterium]